MWVLVLLALSAFVLSLARTALQRSAVPKSLPWVGKPSKGLFSETRAHLKSFGDIRPLVVEGYAKVALPIPCSHYHSALTFVAVLAKGKKLCVSRLLWKTRNRFSK